MPCSSAIRPFLSAIDSHCGGEVRIKSWASLLCRIKSLRASLLPRLRDIKKYKNIADIALIQVIHKFAAQCGSRCPQYCLKSQHFEHVSTPAHWQPSFYFKTSPKEQQTREKMRYHDSINICHSYNASQYQYCTTHAYPHLLHKTFASHKTTRVNATGSTVAMHL